MWDFSSEDVRDIFEGAVAVAVSYATMHEIGIWYQKRFNRRLNWLAKVMILLVMNAALYVLVRKFTNTFLLK